MVLTRHDCTADSVQVERHLRSVVIVPLGYRAAQEDWLVNLKKVRRARADFVTEIN